MARDPSLWNSSDFYEYIEAGPYYDYLYLGGPNSNKTGNNPPAYKMTPRWGGGVIISKDKNRIGYCCDYFSFNVDFDGGDYLNGVSIDDTDYEGLFKINIYNMSGEMVYSSSDDYRFGYSDTGIRLSGIVSKRDVLGYYDKFEIEIEVLNSAGTNVIYSESLSSGDGEGYDYIVNDVLPSDHEDSLMDFLDANYSQYSTNTGDIEDYKSMFNGFLDSYYKTYTEFINDYYGRSVAEEILGMAVDEGEFMGKLLEMKESWGTTSLIYLIDFLSDPDNRPEELKPDIVGTYMNLQYNDSTGFLNIDTDYNYWEAEIYYYYGKDEEEFVDSFSGEGSELVDLASLTKFGPKYVLRYTIVLVYDADYNLITDI